MFSSRITSTDANEVQLSNKACLNNSSTAMNSARLSDMLSYRSQTLNEYAMYTLRCYRDEMAANTQMCHTYSAQRLPYTMDVNASCPFSKEMCRSPNQNVLLDTGYLDSSEHFGINTSPRFQFRYKRHCAPLVTEGYTEVHIRSSLVCVKHDIVSFPSIKIAYTSSCSPTPRFAGCLTVIKFWLTFWV